MKNFFTGWIAIVAAAGAIVQAQLELGSTIPRTHFPTSLTPPPPERWLGGCECGNGGSGGVKAAAATCSDKSVCDSQQYLDIVLEKMETSNLCTCLPCGQGYTLAISCTTCNECNGRSCFEVARGEGYYIDSNG